MSIINLGDKIELAGSEIIDGATMIILKKMIGNHFREISQTKEIDKLLLDIKKQDNFTIAAKMLHQNGEINSEISHSNLFMGMDSALKEIRRQM